MSKKLLLGLFLSVTASALGAVPDGWTVEPTDGTNVTEIKTFVIKKNNGRFDTYVNRKIKINNTDYVVDQKVSGTTDDTNTITIREEAITEAGTYNIVIPEGTFDYNYNWMMEEGDPSPEISFTLKIEGDTPPGPGPDEFTPIENQYYIITPEQGKVGGIKTLTVEYERSSLLPEGYGSNKPTLVNETSGETVAIFNVEEGGGMRDVTLTLAETYTEAGTYLVRIPDQAICGSNDDDWPAADFRYVIDPSIPVVVPQENVNASPESGSSVKVLDKVLLTFPDVSEVYASGPEKDHVIVKYDGEATDIKATFELNSSTMETGQIGLNFTPAITATGEYEIYVPARALSLSASTFDSRFNDEFTLTYTVTGPLAEGTKIKAGDLYYKVLSGTDMTLSVTWPEKDSEYSGIKEIPAQVEYEGDTYTVTEVGYIAFSEIKGISSIKIPDTVTKIDEGAFWESSLSEITIPASVKEIGESAFENTRIKEITIPETVEVLGSDVFSLCSALETINLNNVITYIPDNMASGCTLIKAITLPQCITKIGEFAFSECAVLTEISLPEGVTEIGRFAFAYTPELKELPLPENVTTLGHGVFYQSGIGTASLPENITVIPDGTYQCCVNLKEFTVSDNVTEIEKEAFYWCFGLEKISLGAKVATIGSDVFKGDKALTEVTSHNPEPPVGVVFENEVYETATLYVPESAKEAYKNAEGWKQFSRIETIGNSVGMTDDGMKSFTATPIPGGIMVSSDRPVEIFDAQGIKVYSGAEGEIPMSAGLYIVVSGDKAVKVLL